MEEINIQGKNDQDIPLPAKRDRNIDKKIDRYSQLDK
jgi:hypothetical protein